MESTAPQPEKRVSGVLVVTVVLGVVFLFALALGFAGPLLNSTGSPPANVNGNLPAASERIDPLADEGKTVEELKIERERLAKERDALAEELKQLDGAGGATPAEKR